MKISSMVYRSWRSLLERSGVRATSGTTKQVIPRIAPHPPTATRRSPGMKKIIAVAGLALAATGLAAPAHADNDSNFGSGVNAANNWNFTAADVCIQELAVVPALSDWSGNHKNNCSVGNVIDESAESAAAATGLSTAH